MWFPLIVFHFFFFALLSFGYSKVSLLSFYQCRLVQQGRQKDKLLLGILDPSCN